jgi:hypothetical protein
MSEVKYGYVRKERDALLYAAQLCANAWDKGDIEKMKVACENIRSVLFEYDQYRPRAF